MYFRKPPKTGVIMIPTIEIDNDGNIQTLYSDEIDLYAIGEVHSVRRASNVEFDEANQEWMVIQASTDKIIHRNKNRKQAISWEILELGVGGKYYIESKE